jgi:DEAD/DEAH box helicase domain-containing protein
MEIRKKIIEPEGDLQGVREYIQALKASKRLGGQVVFHKVFPAEKAAWSEPDKRWPPEIEHVVRAAKFHNLYRHQAQGIDVVRSGQHLVMATPTASGKTLIYNLTVLERFVKNPDSKSLYVFPLKALAQDQLQTLNRTASYMEGRKPTAGIYDGDTSAWHRKRMREKPPNILLTNPEMLHLSFLPHHQKWQAFLSSLETVVVDEVHTYRGVMGSHMAQVFRRLRRICSYYRSDPLFIFNSATVANPSELAAQLTGFNVHAITESGSPKGRRHILFIDPLEGPAQTAILLLKAALKRGLRTIVYTQSRKLTELIAIWAGSYAGEYAGRISAYRAGFLPEERREIEHKLANGDLLAVISTSALELGIDIGDLDLCLLVGYPGTIVSTWQREGRVGRSGQDSAMVLIAGEDALDQYFMRNPEDFLRREPEMAVVNPYNTEILAKHAACAAAELPLEAGESFMVNTAVQSVVNRLESSGDLLINDIGDKWFSSRKSPHRHINLRGVGSRFNIIDSQTGDNKGEIDGFRAFKETHPGAIYLHRGDTFLVDALDLEINTVRVTETKVDYYTRVRAHKETDILEVRDEKAVWGTTVSTGKLRVTEQVTGFERWRIRSKKLINRTPLDLPPQTFETEGLWFKIPSQVQMDAESRYMHFMGGIHAVEHAAIGMFPLIVMADRNDLGGISIPLHPQLDCAAVFIYDGIPGGAGLSRQAFLRAEELLRVTLKAIQTCPCENGCPSCVHSPKCGSGNRPIDKASAAFILDKMKTSPRKGVPRSRSNHQMQSIPVVQSKNRDTIPHVEMEKAAEQAGHVQRDRKKQPVLKGKAGGRVRKRREKRQRKQYMAQRDDTKTVVQSRVQAMRLGVLDLETQYSAQEVGGWHRADLMKISCAVLYDSSVDDYLEFMEDGVPELVQILKKFDCIVGFNIKRFDYNVLNGYTDFDFKRLPTLDILEEVHNHLGYRLSLNHLASVTLGAEKTGDGLQALRWWKMGKVRELLDYCKEDVRLTLELYRFGCDKGYLLFKNKAGNTVRVPVDFSLEGNFSKGYR